SSSQSPPPPIAKNCRSSFSCSRCCCSSCCCSRPSRRRRRSLSSATVGRPGWWSPCACPSFEPQPPFTPACGVPDIDRECCFGNNGTPLSTPPSAPPGTCCGGAGG
ncbi:unnamed protein product, partial [Ectocarpus sp. 6 AP-2014]